MCNNSILAMSSFLLEPFVKICLAPNLINFRILLRSSLRLVFRKGWNDHHADYFTRSGSMSIFISWKSNLISCRKIGLVNYKKISALCEVYAIMQYDDLL